MEKEANQLYRRHQMTGQARDEEEEDLNAIHCVYLGMISIHIRHTTPNPSEIEVIQLTLFEKALDYNDEWL